MKQFFKKSTAIILVLMMVMPLITAIAPFVSFAVPRNVAVGKPTTTQSGDGSAAVDGDSSTFWDGGPCPTTLTLDLQGEYEVSKIKIMPYYADGRVYTFRIEYSLDGAAYQLYAEKLGNEKTTVAGFTYENGIVSWYAELAQYQCSYSSQTYAYAAIG